LKHGALAAVAVLVVGVQHQLYEQAVLVVAAVRIRKGFLKPLIWQARKL
jgi:hypothetical protein